MCSLNLLKQKKFWLKLINNKIKEVTEEKTKAEIDKKEKGYNARGNTNEKSGTSKYWGIFTSGNKKVEYEIVFQQKYTENLPIYCLEVIEEYIKHFSNFNLSKERSIEIVNDIYNISVTIFVSYF